MSTTVGDSATLVGSSNTSESNVSGPGVHEKTLCSHSKYLKYKELSKSPEWILTGLEKENLVPSLTGHVLMGTDKIEFRDNTIYFINEKYSEFPEIPGVAVDNYSVTFLYLGSMLTGHSGIIHGGLLATLLDELTCRLAFQNFHSKKGVTANLNINYRKPCYEDSYVMIKCTVLEKKGRKCRVKGSVYHVDLSSDDSIEDVKNLLAECEILVIEPKWVQDLNRHPATG